MKKILLLTDFSANADNAAAWALGFAEKLGGGLVLFHSLKLEPISPYYGGGAFVSETGQLMSEESTEKLSELSEAMRDRAKDKSIVIEQLSGEGSLGDFIGAMTKGEKFELIVMGARSGGVLEHLLTGSDTQQVIDNAVCPVLIIPAASQNVRLNKAVLATDFNKGDLKAVDYLNEWAAFFDLQLEIAHVLLPGEKVDTAAELAFRKGVNRRENQEMTYHEVSGEELSHRLNRLCSMTKADILAMVHYEQGFFDRLFGHSESKDALDKQRVPLLIFPPAFAVAGSKCFDKQS